MQKRTIVKVISTFVTTGVILTIGTTGALGQTTGSSNAPKASNTTKTTTTNSSTKQNNTQNNFQAQYQKTLQTSLDGLVKKGTITKAQETKVLAALNKRNANRQRNGFGQNRPNGSQGFGNGQANGNGKTNNFQNMTEEQRKAFMQNMNKNRFNPLADLVKAKTITQKQADEINKIVSSARGSFRRPQN